MESAERPVERVILVGFMGSGKTSVGRALASELGWNFLDFDREIERRAGCSIPELFRREGEPAFRRLEADVGRRLLERERVVLATGGGWAAAEGRLDPLPAGTLSVWLEVSAETAVRRASLDDVERPLLEGPDPVRMAAHLLDERTAYYARAKLALDSESATPEVLAKTIAGKMNSNRSVNSG